MTDQVRRQFYEIFNEEPRLFQAPGRINLIGEHTDYNAGWVLPGAIDKRIYLGISLRKDVEVHIHALDYKQSLQVSQRPVTRTGRPWADYLLGVISQFELQGVEVPGLNIVFAGDIPQGAGMSSSAALETVLAIALNELLDLNYSKLMLARMGQAAEQKFLGVNCGLMDQFASVMGKSDHLIRLDCRSLEHTYIPFHTEGYDLVLLDTGVKHALADSAYNDRRALCERGLEQLKAACPGVETLRDVNPEMLEATLKKADPEAYEKCAYVLAENKRVLDACRSLRQGDMEALGQLLFQSHQGLKEAYQVSCAELDMLVDSARMQEGVLGARMMGGGFGGCTINLIRHTHRDAALGAIQAYYRQASGKNLQIYPVHISHGACPVHETRKVC